MDATQICYIVTLAVAIGFFIWGFMELLKKRQPNEKDTVDVISRQIRGFAFLMLTSVVLIFGAWVCYGFSGGLETLGSRLKQAARY